MRLDPYDPYTPYHAFEELETPPYKWCQPFYLSC